MSKMEQDINHHLRQAISELTPDYDEQLWKEPAEEAMADDWYLQDNQPGKKSKRRASARRSLSLIMTTVAACLILAVTVFYQSNVRVLATVCLDVNPAITLKMNRRDRVVYAAATNEEGAQILNGMDLKGTDIDVAVNAILGAMIKNHYLEGNKDTVLLSVTSEDRKKAEQLRLKLYGNVEACMSDSLKTKKILDQSFVDDDDLEDLAEAYGITQGKAALIRMIIEAHPELSFTDLAALPIDDLLEKMKSLHIDLREYIDYHGDDFWDDDLEDVFESDDDDHDDVYDHDDQDDDDRDDDDHDDDDDGHDDDDHDDDDHDDDDDQDDKDHDDDDHNDD